MDLPIYHYLHWQVLQHHQLISFLLQFDEEDNRHVDFVFSINIFRVVRENIVSNPMEQIKLNF